jgi:glycosyltransferase involved in cell wall biosynthesis
LSASTPEGGEGSLRFNLCGNDIGAGLSRDIAILRSTLAPLGEIEVSADKQFDAARWGRTLLAQQLFRRSPFAANIFLETVWGRWLFCAPRNWLIPNPEWLAPDHLGLVRQTDCVLCKTRSALELFRKLGIRAEFIGFTSEDRWLGRPLWEQPVRRALHIAGRSLQKGTATLVDVWRHHPEWPELVVVQRPAFPGWRFYQPQAANLTWITERISDEELRRLQNSSQVHISPSDAEGFGHVLVEALSCGGVLITTDGAPMNEIVTPERGLLARPWRRGRKLLGDLSLVDPRALEEACRTALALSDTEREKLGRAARAWYLDNDAGHRERLVAVVQRELR